MYLSRGSALKSRLDPCSPEFTRRDHLETYKPLAEWMQGECCPVDTDTQTHWVDRLWDIVGKERDGVKLSWKILMNGGLDLLWPRVQSTVKTFVYMLSRQIM